MKPQPAYFDLDDNDQLKNFQLELDKIDEQHRLEDLRKKREATQKAADEAKQVHPNKAA
jgi:hypothetical protein